jgi:hypothetical protein
MKASIKGGNRCFGNSLGFSWLWGHFEGFGFEVQGIVLVFVEMRKGFQFLETIQGVMLRVLEVQNWFCFNDSFN